MNFSYNLLLCYLAKGFRKFIKTKADKGVCGHSERYMKRWLKRFDKSGFTPEEVAFQQKMQARTLKFLELHPEVNNCPS